MGRHARKVPRSKGEDRDVGPYPQRAIARRIQKLAAEKGHPEGKQIAYLLDAAPNWWTRRGGKNPDTTLKLSEISLLAEKLEAPPGWPFLDDHHMKALARGLAELAKEAAGGGDPQAPPAKASSDQTAQPRRRRRGSGGT
jgi:hypothetical protein